MPPKECPNCGNRVSNESTSCPCGFAFQAGGLEVRGSSAAREVSQRWSEKPRKRVKPARKGDPSRRSASATKRPRKAPTAETSPAPTEAVKEVELSGPRADLLMGCPGCAARISKRAKRCPKCGEAPFAPCGICGERIVAGSPECPECGDPEPFAA